ncbi:MAG TPA: hypothetical protein VGC93_04615, partial [Thermoanaerobaculia bacterium]
MHPSGSPLRSLVATLVLLVPASTALAQREAAESPLILLESRTIDTRRPQPAHEAARAGEAAGAAGGEVLLLKFPRPIAGWQAEAMRREGLRVYTYLPHDAFLV